MKTIIERSDLLKALNHVQSVVERRNTIPILSNVLLEADNGVLALTATDLEIEMRERVEAEIVQAGAITAPAHMLYDIVRKLPDGAQVELATDETGGRLNLVAGKSAFTLQALPREDFPAMAQDEMPAAFALPVNDLRRLIEKTRFAISVEETRYYLNGIICMFWKMAGPICCAPWRLTATVWRGWKWRSRSGPIICHPSLFRAKPSAKCKNYWKKRKAKYRCKCRTRRLISPLPRLF